MIVYTADAQPARAYLLRRYNDIDVFVEDVNCQNMYIRLVNRLLDGRAKITDVFPLQTRKNVLDKCAEDQSPRSRKRIYIIDGDLELVRGKPSPPLNHLHRLEVYCSENLLLSENACIALATECDTNCNWLASATKLNLHPLLEGAVKMLFPLFIAYGLVAELRLTVPTVSYSVALLMTTNANPLTLSSALIKARIADVMSEVRKQARSSDYATAREKIRNNLKGNTLHKSVFISGKDYLLKIIWFHMQRVAKFREPYDVFKMRLAQYSELELASGLKDAILREL